jgi:hypothetical protein
MVEGLRDFLTRLEGRGELIRFRKEVDPRFEVAALIRDVQQRRNQPVLFERVKGSALPIVSNVCGSYASVSAALRVEPRELARTWAERLTRAAAVPAVEPVSSQYQASSLGRLPICTHCEKDAGPYITAGIVAARDLETGLTAFDLLKSSSACASTICATPTRVCRSRRATRNTSRRSSATHRSRRHSIATGISCPRCTRRRRGSSTDWSSGLGLGQGETAMTRAWIICAALVLAGGLPLPATAGEPSAAGTWTGTMSREAFKVDFTMVLAQDGQAVRGTFSSKVESGGRGFDNAPIRGTLTGDKLMLTWGANVPSGARVLNAIISGNTMTRSVAAGNAEPAAVTGTRAK